MTVLAQPRLLDLCRKAGGASRGYDDAGFLVTGLDHEPQPRYPYEFIQADVLGFLEENAETLKDRYDAIGASFPCILFSSLTRATGKASEHLDLVTPGRSLLDKTGLPYVIENVPQAPLRDPVIFCGPSFGLEVIRHRAFETGGGFTLTAPPCSHVHGGVADGLYVAFYPSRRTPPGAGARRATPSGSTGQPWAWSG